MRSTVRATLLALAAILALGAVSASSALASPEWYVKESGVYKKVTTPLKVTIGYNYELNDAKAVAGFGLIVACKFEGEGEISSGGTGVISNFSTGLNCKGVVGKSGVTTCERFEKSASVSIPWKIELYKEGSEIRQRIVSGGGGTPSWAFGCSSAVFGSISDTCGVNTNTHMTDNATEGLVEAGFDTKSAKTECTEGGKEAAEWKGALKIKATSGAAIKVE
jgi:hypothetical protein